MFKKEHWLLKISNIFQLKSVLKNFRFFQKNFFLWFPNFFLRHHDSARYGCFHGPVIAANSANAVQPARHRPILRRVNDHHRRFDVFHHFLSKTSSYARTGSSSDAKMGMQKAMILCFNDSVGSFYASGHYANRFIHSSSARSAD